MNILKGNQLRFGLTPLFVTFSVASRQFLGRLSPFLLETDQIYKLMWLKIHTHKARLFSNNVLTKTRSIALWRCVSAHCLPIILVCCSSTFSHLSSIHMRGMTRLIGSTDTGQRCVHSSVSQYLLRLKAAVLCKLREKSFSSFSSSLAQGFKNSS